MNEQTAESVAFFAITFGAFQIGDSAPAPLLETSVRPNEWVKRNVRERKQAHREMRNDYDWDSYVAEVGHEHEKITIARALAEKIESITDWKSLHFKNQVVYQTLECRRPLAIQFGGRAFE